MNKPNHTEYPFAIGRFTIEMSEVYQSYEMTIIKYKAYINKNTKLSYDLRQQFAKGEEPYVLENGKEYDLSLGYLMPSRFYKDKDGNWQKSMPYIYIEMIDPVKELPTSPNAT